MAGAGEHGLPAHGLEHVARDLHGLLAAALGQQHRELVAAEPREHVGVAQPRAQRPRDAHDQLVAGAVAERVVDRLEVVEVEHQRGAARPVALDQRDVALELALERAPVEQPVSGSWSARWRSSASWLRRSVTSCIWLRKYSGVPSSRRTSVLDSAAQTAPPLACR